MERTKRNVNVRALCAVTGISLAELSNRTGINAPKLRRIARGVQIADVDELLNICGAVGMSVEKALSL